MRVGCLGDLGSCLVAKKAEVFKKAGVLYTIFITKQPQTSHEGYSLAFEKALKNPGRLAYLDENRVMLKIWYLAGAWHHAVAATLMPLYCSLNPISTLPLRHSQDGQ